MVWISVKDRLPPLKQKVLVFVSPNYYDQEQYVAYIEETDEESQDWVYTDCGCRLHTITHWMPLPNPPKEKE